MRKGKYWIAGGVVLLLLVVLKLVFPGVSTETGKDPESSASMGLDHADPPDRHEFVAKTSGLLRSTAEQKARTGDGEIEKLKKELAEATAELETLSRPLREDVSSAVVHARMKEGEMLVTGGYVRPDGRHEITCITPERTRLEDGTEAVKVFSKILTMEPDALQGTALEAIGTKVRNTMQHGEVWGPEDAMGQFRRISSVADVDILSSPSVTQHFGEWTTIQLGDTPWNYYQLQTRVTVAEDDSLDVLSRVEMGGEGLSEGDRELIERGE